MEKKKYPICPEDYKLFEEIGHGVSARVYRALCIPLNEIVAIKVLDLEKVNNDLANISREAQTMILIDHPNVLKAHCSFVNDHNLWVVTPFMAGGSCLHILKAAYPDGFGEAVIATILREVLKGLEYLHHHGHIHRDVKAGNILVDASGAVKLGDFGVSACLFDSGDRQRMRNTFVGTPCWMAPEVMEQLHGYDFKADIWSFGITALELAHGHAPFSKYPPMKVLLMTLQNAPPGLDYERDRKFSKSFKQMIAMCLVKDPSKRPSSSKLLKHPFFRQARSNDYIARTIIEGLPTLVDRLEALKEKEADMLAQKKMPDGEKEEISQNEYKRGISGWNFDIEDLKAQASLIQDVEALLCKEQGESSSDSSLFSIDCSPEKQSQSLAPIMENDVAYKESENVMRVRPAPLPLPGRTVNAPKGKVDNFADQRSAVGPTDDSNILQSMPFKLPYHSNGNENKLDEKFELEVDQKQPDHIPSPSYHRRVASDSTELLHPTRGTSDKQQSQPQRMANGTAASLAVSDPSSDNSARTSSNCDDPDEKSKAPVIQQKGRFKVTSESVEKALLPSPVLQKSHSMQVFAQPSAVSLPLPLDATSNLLGSSLFPQLHSILQTNILQRDNILNLMKQVTIGETSSANRISNAGSIPTATIVTEKSLLEAANEREKELLQEITDLQWRLVCVTDELQRVKTKNAQV